MILLTGASLLALAKSIYYVILIWYYQINNKRQRNDSKIEDFCDGEMFRNHPLFSRDPTALQLFLYYDEVELTNPLGSKTGKHKLGVCQ